MITTLASLLLLLAAPAPAETTPPPDPATTPAPTTPPPPPAKTKAGSKAKGKTTRTYGRATTTSDKENAGGDEPLSEDEDNNDVGNTSLSMRDVAHSKELEEARLVHTLFYHAPQ